MSKLKMGISFDNNIMQAEIIPSYSTLQCDSTLYPSSHLTLTIYKRNRSPL